MTKFRVIIPGRYGSTRLPAKVLMDIHGKSMLQRVYERSKLSQAASVIIATDDDRVFEHVRSFTSDVFMTASHHLSGTERIAELVNRPEFSDEDIIVNVQGDLPLVPPQAIDQVANYLIEQPDLQMATLCQPIHRFDDVQSPHVVKVIFDARHHAIYFSRSPIPWPRTISQADFIHDVYYKHIGIYAYRVGFLKQYVQWPVSQLETVESLEQLRVIWQGVKIFVGVSETADSPSVDSQEDLDNVRDLISSHGLCEV